MNEETIDIEMTLDEYLAALMNGAYVEVCESDARPVLWVLVGLGLAICEVGESVNDEGHVVQTEDFKTTEELRTRMNKLGKFDAIFLDAEDEVVTELSSRLQ